MIRMVLFALALLAAAPTASIEAAPPASLTPAEQRQVQKAIELGTLLYRYDQSAWHVSDAFVASSASKREGLRGYVTTPSPDGLRTTFFGGNEGHYVAAYSATWTGSAIKDAKEYLAGSEPPLTAEEARLVNARKIAIESTGSLGMCSAARPNVIVVPDSADQTLHVYILTPQSENGVYPLGGHHRFDVLDDKIVNKRAFSKSCVRLSFDQFKGQKPVMFGVTHLLDPVPTELHVFTVLSSKLPLGVSVPDGRMYEISAPGGQPRITIIGTLPTSGNILLKQQKPL